MLYCVACVHACVQVCVCVCVLLRGLQVSWEKTETFTFFAYVESTNGIKTLSNEIFEKQIMNKSKFITLVSKDVLKLAKRFTKPHVLAIISYISFTM